MRVLSYNIVAVLMLSVSIQGATIPEARTEAAAVPNPDGSPTFFMGTLWTGINYQGRSHFMEARSNCICYNNRDNGFLLGSVQVTSGAECFGYDNDGCTGGWSGPLYHNDPDVTLWDWTSIKCCYQP